ncbi:hypothetical protein MPSEU_000861000 [Mayamaea pseudoterrestris]|nr:hypothetical protein MPSEU_000861000 [Mayamaea pseudoterrestris]
MAATLHGTDIRKILTEPGPVVKAVLLKHMAASGKDEHPSLACQDKDATASEHSHRLVLPHMIDEIELDTTPSKQQVKQVLGGPWTFLGQYEEEGIVIMMRQPIPGTDDDDNSESENEEEVVDILETLSLEQLQNLCSEYFVEVDNDAAAKPSTAAGTDDSEATKQTLIKALQAARETMASQVNPHKLQPPFDEVVIHGDLLLLRVAETDEVLDKDDEDEDENGDEEANTKPAKDLTVLSNQEFFLDYTKDEYIAFASRTDVVAPEPPEHSDEEEDEEEEEDEDDDDEEEGDEDDGDEDEAFELGDDGDREGLLNLLMNEVLRKFREDNGRGPNSEEVLAMRSAVAEKLGVQVVTTLPEESNETANKRAASEASGDTKRVKFSASFEKDDDEDDAAAEERQEADEIVNEVEATEEKAGDGGEEDKS